MCVGVTAPLLVSRITVFFFSSRRRHTRFDCDWSSDVCSSDLKTVILSGSAGNKYKGTIRMEKDGAYHVAAIDQGQPVRLSEDYFIATDKATQIGRASCRERV